MSVESSIQQLASGDIRQRAEAAKQLFNEGVARVSDWLVRVEGDSQLRSLIVRVQTDATAGTESLPARLTVGIAVLPKTFEEIRNANGSPPLADAPPDQDVLEFELEFEGDFARRPRLDILTTKAPGGGGAIDRFLQRFGEGIQQIEIDVSDVDRATQILRSQFQTEPIYPQTHPGANGTRVNFFLVATAKDKKVLVELVEQPKTQFGQRDSSP